MATSAAQKRNRYTLSTVLFLFLIFLSFFFFSKQALEPKLTIYRDLFTETPKVSFLNSPVRSTEIPVASNPQLDDNATALGDEEIPSSSAEVPLVSNPNLDLEIGEKSTVLNAKDASIEAPISSKSETGDEINGTMKTLVDLEAQVRDNERPSSSNSQSDEQDNTRMEETEPGCQQWRNCDFYQGRWVKDEGYPIYRPGSCPYVDEAFDCQSNGRPDSEYLKWRWKPDGCDLPR